MLSARCALEYDFFLLLPYVPHDRYACMSHGHARQPAQFKMRSGQPVCHRLLLLRKRCRVVDVDLKLLTPPTIYTRSEQSGSSIHSSEHVQACWSSHGTSMSVTTRGVVRETSPCCTPAPSPNVSPTSYNPRQRAISFRGGNGNTTKPNCYD